MIAEFPKKGQGTDTKYLLSTAQIDLPEIVYQQWIDSLDEMDAIMRRIMADKPSKTFAFVVKQRDGANVREGYFRDGKGDRTTMSETFHRTLDDLDRCAKSVSVRKSRDGRL